MDINNLFYLQEICESSCFYMSYKQVPKNIFIHQSLTETDTFDSSTIVSKFPFWPWSTKWTRNNKTLTEAGGAIKSILFINNGSSSIGAGSTEAR